MEEVGALVEATYDELRRIAARHLRHERAKSLQATDLVHEAYVRLQRDDPSAWTDRTHFLAIAAIAMRRLLVERSRARGAAKRGGGQLHVTLDDTLVAAPETSVDLVALDDALTRLSQLDQMQARIVELRYFGGSTVEETATALGVSPATVKRHWTIARAWLLRELEGRPRP